MTSTALCRFQTLCIVSFLSMALGACSIYRNRGRDQFEKRAPGNVTATEVSSKSDSHHISAARDTDLVIDEDFSSCWIQNKDEALWSTPQGSRLEIRDINDKKMAVCLETEQHD